MLPRTPERERSIDALRARAEEIRGELYANLTPWQRVLVARHPAGRTRSTTSSACSPASTSCTATAASPTITPSSAASPNTRAAGRGRRAPEGPRHQAEDLPELRLRAARGLSQGAARHAAGAEVLPADHRLHRHAGRVSGRRVGRARRGRGDRLQPARDDHARGPDRRHRLRRGRQRRRARHCHRRPGADAGILGLQRHPAGRLRRDPVAGREQESRSRGGAQDHGVGSAGARPDRRASCPEPAAVRTTTTTRRRRWSTRRWPGAVGAVDR